MKYKVEKILIIRLSSLGDVLLSTPLIRALRTKFPQAQIDYLIRTEYIDLILHNPHLSGLMKFDIKSGFAGLKRLRGNIKNRRYDVIIDIQRSLRSRYLCFGISLLSGFRTRILKVRKNQIMRFFLVKFKINLYRTLYHEIIPVWKKYLKAASILSLDGDSANLELHYSDYFDNWASRYLKNLPGGDWQIVVAPGAKHFTKRWPVEYYTELIETIHRQLQLKTILVGGENDLPVISVIQDKLREGISTSTAGQISILKTAAIVKKASLVISNDSGLMHIAAALDRPLIAIFGSTTEELGFFPKSERATVIENKNLYCRPCTHIGRSSCPEGHFKCMEDITPAKVYALIQNKIKNIE